MFRVWGECMQGTHQTNGANVRGFHNSSHAIETYNSDENQKLAAMAASCDLHRKAAKARLAVRPKHKPTCVFAQLHSRQYARAPSPQKTANSSRGHGLQAHEIGMPMCHSDGLMWRQNSNCDIAGSEGRQTRNRYHMRFAHKTRQTSQAMTGP